MWSPIQLPLYSSTLNFRLAMSEDESVTRYRVVETVRVARFQFIVEQLVENEKWQKAAIFSYSTARMEED